MMVWGQAAEFEVASVKPSGPKSDRDSSGGPGTADPGRYSFHSATLLDLIATAYHVDYFQISGKALEEQRYDLDAKLPPHTTREEFRAMLRNLLVERFHLKAHIEQRQFPGYELILAKTGSKLKQSDGSQRRRRLTGVRRRTAFRSCPRTGRAWRPGTPPPAPRSWCG